jgi:hypothetical protein
MHRICSKYEDNIFYKSINKYCTSLLDKEIGWNLLVNYTVIANNIHIGGGCKGMGPWTINAKEAAKPNVTIPFSSPLCTDFVLNGICSERRGEAGWNTVIPEVKLGGGGHSTSLEDRF